MRPRAPRPEAACGLRIKSATRTQFVHEVGNVDSRLPVTAHYLAKLTKVDITPSIELVGNLVEIRPRLLQFVQKILKALFIDVYLHELNRASTIVDVDDGAHVVRHCNV